MSIDHPCVDCGAPLSLQALVQRTRVGRYKVDDGSLVVPVCADGHAELDLEQVAGYERRAAAVVLAEGASIGGGEVRFARKALA
jgi:hypothetical protein